MNEHPVKQTVLVVDGVPMNIDVLAGIVQDEYHVKAATSGEKALKIARSYQWLKGQQSYHGMEQFGH